MIKRQDDETLAVATVPIALHQVEWNPLHHEEEMLALCQKHRIQLQAWSPLGGSEGDVLSHPTIVKIAAAHKTSTAQVVLKWSLQRGVAVVTVRMRPWKTELSASSRSSGGFGR